MTSVWAQADQQIHVSNYENEKQNINLFFCNTGNQNI